MLNDYDLSVHNETDQNHLLSSINPKIVARYRNTCINTARLFRGRDAEAMEVLKRAFNLGFRRFDISEVTKSTIQDSLAEAYIMPHRHEFSLVTQSVAKSPDLIIKDLEQACSNAKTDYMDAFFLTNPGLCYHLGDGTGMIECLEDAKTSGKIKQYGLRTRRYELAKQAIEQNAFPIVAYPLSYLSSEAEIALIQLAASRGVLFWADEIEADDLATDLEAIAAFLFTQQSKPIMIEWKIENVQKLVRISSYYDNAVGVLDEESNFYNYLTPAIEKRIRADRFVSGSYYCRDCHVCEPCTVGIEISFCATIMNKIHNSPYPKEYKAATPNGGLTDEQSTSNNQKDLVSKRIEKTADCTECQLCRNKCPYHIEVPKLLRRNLDAYKKFAIGMDNDERNYY